MGDTLNEIEARASEYASAPGFVGGKVAQVADDTLWLVGRVRELERERAQRGPCFVRDMARIAGLPDDASMDVIADALSSARAGSVGATKAASGEERE